MKTITCFITVMAMLFLTLFIPNTGLCLITMLSTEELVRQADHIIIGEVISTKCQWDAEHRLIYTFATVKVEENIKDISPASHLTIRYLGGTVDNITLVASGCCTLSKSEKVLLYLEKEDSNTFRILGNALGKYQIIYDSKTNTEFVKNDFRSFAESGKEEDLQEKIRLEDYSVEIRSILQKTEQQGASE